jgi:hypothetical protein
MIDIAISKRISSHILFFLIVLLWPQGYAFEQKSRNLTTKLRFFLVKALITLSRSIMKIGHSNHLYFSLETGHHLYSKRTLLFDKRLSA